MNDEKVEETTPEVASEEEVVANDGNGETAVSDTTTPVQPTCEELLAVSQEEAAKNLDGWMRAQAEFANARKRMEKQRVEIQVRAATDMVTRLLPVIDDFERAFDNVPDIIREDSWFAGIELVNRKLANVLESFNVETIQAVGQMFDPNCHEAIMQEPSDEYESGVVIKELQKGYKMGDRVIRPSLVNVAA